MQQHASPAAAGIVQPAFCVLQLTDAFAVPETVVMRSTLFFAAFVLAPLVPLSAADAPPFRNPNLPLEQRVQDLLGRLTLEQKAQVLNHRGPTVLVDGFALRADQWNQCLNGVKWDRPTTLFPICLAMAATWDANLVHNTNLLVPNLHPLMNFLKFHRRDFSLLISCLRRMPASQFSPRIFSGKP